ncbi:hypothetical protein FB451DRAFT_1372154 [Mycena latifolia]|nr:hypothetical protein FB451DRAFT_1372154 [Mycena latifolia]
MRAQSRTLTSDSPSIPGPTCRRVESLVQTRVPSQLLISISAIIISGGRWRLGARSLDPPVERRFTDSSFIFSVWTLPEHTHPVLALALAAPHKFRPDSAIHEPGGIASPRSTPATLSAHSALIEVDRREVSFRSPDFHNAEALELRLIRPRRVGNYHSRMMFTSIVFGQIRGVNSDRSMSESAREDCPQEYDKSILVVYQQMGGHECLIPVRGYGLLPAS